MVHLTQDSRQGGRINQQHHSVIRFPQAKHQCRSSAIYRHSLGEFDSELGILTWDVAAAAYEQKRVYTVVADQGPKCKIGEGSIELHERLGHIVCKARDRKVNCTNLRNTGVERDIQYFIFLQTSRKLITKATPENINQRINSIGKTS